MAAFVEGVIILLVLAGLALSVHLSRRRRRRRIQESRLLTSVLPTLDRESDPRSALDQLTALPQHLRVPAVLRLADQVTGDASVLLRAVAVEAGVTRVAESWCRRRRWRFRLRGVRTFSVLGGGEGVVPHLLDDRNPAVRAEAAAWVVTCPTAEHVDRLVLMLEDVEPLCAFTARDTLMRVGPAAAGPLAAYLAKPIGSRAAAALEVARGVAEPRLLAPGLLLCGDADPAVRVRAADLVSAVGGEAAVDRLTHLLTRDDAPGVRAAAARGLGTMAHRPSAPALADAMRDRSWEVRRAAALALRALDAQGRLYLRRTLQGSDLYAADMARQVLELPEIGVEVLVP
ncbi:MAG TPA: HEAT repeat domain-containing protein [Nocardioides sp.]|nr:HEAT repeat domain-containing protein [Nocardioides sp.]